MSQTSTTHMVWLKRQMVKTETSEVNISWFLALNVGQAPKPLLFLFDLSWNSTSPVCLDRVFADGRMDAHEQVKKSMDSMSKFK